MAESAVMLHQAEHRLYQLGDDLLATVRDMTGFVAVMSAFTDLAENLAGHRPVACAAGCPYCCVLNVSVLLPEAVAIAAWLMLHNEGAGRAALLSRLQAHALRVRWMEDSERIHRQTFCPFLDAHGSCSIYPVRPLACRGVTSLDKQACLTALDPTVFDNSYAVPMDTTRRMMMDAAFCALGRALQQRSMSSRSIELCGGVSAFLANPALVGVLLAGGSLPEDIWG